MQTSISHWRNMAEHMPRGKDPARKGSRTRLWGLGTNLLQGDREGSRLPLPLYHHHSKVWRAQIHLKTFPQTCRWRNVIWKEMLWGRPPSESDSLPRGHKALFLREPQEKCFCKFSRLTEVLQSSQHTKFQSIRDRHFCWSKLGLDCNLWQ